MVVATKIKLLFNGGATVAVTGILLSRKLVLFAEGSVRICQHSFRQHKANSNLI